MEVKSYSHHTVSTVHPVNKYLSLLRVRFVRFLNYKVVSYLSKLSFERKFLYALKPTLKEWGIVWNSSAWEIDWLIDQLVTSLIYIIGLLEMYFILQGKIQCCFIYFVA